MLLLLSSTVRSCVRRDVTAARVIQPRYRAVTGTMAKCFVGDLAFDVTDGAPCATHRCRSRALPLASRCPAAWASAQAPCLRRCLAARCSAGARGACAWRAARPSGGLVALRCCSRACTAEALARRFSEFGEVLSVRRGTRPEVARSTDALRLLLKAQVSKGVSKGKDKETSKGYGFVIFSDEVSAELACTVGKQSGQRIWRVRARNIPGPARALRAAPLRRCVARRA